MQMRERILFCLSLKLEQLTLQLRIKGRNVLFFIWINKIASGGIRGNDYTASHIDCDFYSCLSCLFCMYDSCRFHWRCILYIKQLLSSTLLCFDIIAFRGFDRSSLAAIHILVQRFSPLLYSSSEKVQIYFVRAIIKN